MLLMSCHKEDMCCGRQDFSPSGMMMMIVWAFGWSGTFAQCSLLTHLLPSHNVEGYWRRWEWENGEWWCGGTTPTAETVLAREQYNNNRSSGSVVFLAKLRLKVSFHFFLTFLYFILAHSHAHPHHHHLHPRLN